MKLIMGKPFKLKEIRDTPFSSEQYEAVPDAVTITTVDDYDIDGQKIHAFYATWQYVTQKLKNPELRADLLAGKDIPAMKLVSRPSKKRPGKTYYDLEAA